MTVTIGWFLTFSVTSAEKFVRSTARAPPAGTAVSSAEAITTEFKRRISSFKTPTAFVNPLPRSELLQTSSAKFAV